MTWLRWRGQWATCRHKASTRSGPRWWRWNQRQTAVSRTSGSASSQSSPPSSPPAGPLRLLPQSLWTEQQNILTSKTPTSKYQPLKMVSYPEPRGLVCIQLQSRVSDGSEFRDDGWAVPQYKPETHGAQNWCKSGQVQLLVLHFTKVRIGNRAGCKWQRSGLVFTFAHLHNRLCLVNVLG